MHWNYRVLKFKDSYELRSVYYDERGEPSLHGPATAFGETQEEIQDAIDKMLLGAAKPVITKWEND